MIEIGVACLYNTFLEKVALKVSAATHEQVNSVMTEGEWATCSLLPLSLLRY